MFHVLLHGAVAHCLLCLAQARSVEEAAYYVSATGVVIQAYPCLSGPLIHQIEISGTYSQLKMHLKHIAK